MSMDFEICPPGKSLLKILLFSKMNEHFLYTLIKFRIKLFNFLSVSYQIFAGKLLILFEKDYADKL